jgi:hypothetical protein
MTRMIAGIECDIIIAAKHTMHPLSVTEAKKPHSEPNNKNIFAPTMGQTSRTVGQNYDQLHNVKFMMASMSKPKQHLMQFSVDMPCSLG